MQKQKQKQNKKQKQKKNPPRLAQQPENWKNAT